MVFGYTRMQFSYNTPVTFCPKKPSPVEIPARRKARQPGDVEAADGKRADYVTSRGEGQLLDDMLEA